jgi:outer membrane immunogenic protein
MRILPAVVVLSGLAFSQSAWGADLPVKAPPPPAPVYSWTGFYLGGNVGSVFDDNNSVNVTTINTFNNNIPVLSPLGQTTGPAAAAATTVNASQRWGDIAGGAQAGFNWQVAPTWLLGLEADIQGIGSHGASFGLTQVVPRLGFPGDSVTGTVVATDNVNWLGTVRGRVGFLVTPSWLIYGTGGLAYGSVSSSTTISAAETPNTGTVISNTTGAFSSGTRTGWTAGFGVEAMVAPNFTIKAEWLHYDLGSATYSNGQLVGTLIGTSTTAFIDASTSTVRFSGDIVRVGFNYIFGGAPTAAKY